MLRRSRRREWAASLRCPDGATSGYVELLSQIYPLGLMSLEAGGPAVGLHMSCPSGLPKSPTFTAALVRHTADALTLTIHTGDEDAARAGPGAWDVHRRADEAGKGFSRRSQVVPMILLLKEMRTWFAAPRQDGPIVSDLMRTLWAQQGMPAYALDFDKVLAPYWSQSPMLHADHARRVHEACRTHYVATIDGFLRTLDGEAVDLLHGIARSHGRWWHHLSRWVGYGDWKDLDATFAPETSLRHAVAAYPDHLDVVLDAWELDRGRFASSCVPPIHALVTEQLGPGGVSRAVADACISREAVRKARDRRGDGPWSREEANAGLLARGREGMHVTEATSRLLVLGSLPDSWIPRGEAEWDAFDDVRPALAHADALARCGLDMQAFVNSGGRWVDYRDRLAAAACTRPRTVAHAVTALADMVETFVAQVLVPAVGIVTKADPTVASTDAELRDRLLDIAEELLLGGRSLVRILEGSARFARDKLRIEGMLASLPRTVPPADSWEPGLPDATIGGIAVVVLTTSAELVAEGDPDAHGDGRGGMSNCLADHAPRCLSGRHRIVSLRRPDGIGGFARLSAAQLTSGDSQVTVTQHRGFANGSPPQECVAALAAYLDDVATGRRPMTQVRAVTTLGRDATAAGYDWTTPGAFAQAAGIWARHLPDRCRAWEPTDYVRGAVALIEVPPQARIEPNWRGRVSRLVDPRSRRQETRLTRKAQQDGA